MSLKSKCQAGVVLFRVFGFDRSVESWNPARGFPLFHGGSRTGAASFPQLLRTSRSFFSPGCRRTVFALPSASRSRPGRRHAAVGDIISEPRSFDVALAPAKPFCVFVVSVNEGFDCLAELIFVVEARSAESLPLQQTEHNLNLVEPAGRGRCGCSAITPSRKL